MAFNEDCKRHLSNLAAVGRKPLQELSVAQLADDSDVEDRSKFFGYAGILFQFHRDFVSARRSAGLDSSNVPARGGSSEFPDPRGRNPKNIFLSVSLLRIST